MQYTKPKKLERGDTVAVLSPSWGGPSIFPHIYENGLKILHEWGLKIREFPTTRADTDFLRNNPQLRAKDLNEAFTNPDIKAIFTSIGGDDSIQILPFLDKKTIDDNPKILIGYSDTSTIHLFLNLQGIISFYGPSIMAGFAQMEHLPEKFKTHVRMLLFEPRKDYEYTPYGKYSNGYPDWADKKNLGHVNDIKEDDGWHWLQGDSKVQGQLFGGCVEVLEKIKSTDLWPSEEFWKDKIFFLETSEKKPSLTYIENVLTNYGRSGVFDKISGFIFARARDYSDSEKLELEKKIIYIIYKKFGKTNLPIIANFDVGHTDPQLVLPLGVKAEIDCQNKRFHLVESWLE